MTESQPIELSICIPTYNRARFLSEALNSIAANIDPSINIEIVISDNASTDDTTAVVKSFRDQLLPIRYHRNNQNIGPVANIVNVIQIAKGDFIWIFGDDDIMMPDAVSYLLAFLKRNKTVQYVYYSRELKTVDLSSVPDGIQPKGLTEDITFKNGNDLLCACDGQIPYIIGFLSSTIIRRSIWAENVHEVQKIASNNAWAHLMIILRAIKNCNCAILAKVGVQARMNYQAFKPNSSIGFDDGIICFIDAMKLGYSKNQCTTTIKEIVRLESKAFLADQARGNRTDSILDFLSKNGLSRMVFAAFPWFLVSMLPVFILKRLWSLFNLIRH